MEWLIGAIVAGVILFLWTGLTQNFLPWGIKQVQTPKPEDDERVSKAIASMTTDGMALVSKGVTALVAARPAAYYNMGRYFAIEFVTQMIVGAVLAGILMLTAGQPLETRLLLIGLVVLAGIGSIDLQYWNWWGFSNLYTLGVAVNRLLGYLIAAGVVAAFIIR
jgi:drug/metabolite transporter (DMT)-like permease